MWWHMVFPPVSYTHLDVYKRQSYLYPMSILKGKGAHMEFTGITFAGKGQNLDTGAKVVHAAPDTSSYLSLIHI